MQREIEIASKPRQWPKGKILGSFLLIVLVLGAYAAWQYAQPSPQSTEPPPINPTTPLQTAYEFTMKDVNGTQFSLKGFRGRIIVIHVMAVGCHGQIYSINDNQLKQLKTVCGSFCGKTQVTLITVAVATCPSSDLQQIRSDYGITWLLGNDYDDGKIDIAQKYATQGDGTIVLIDKAYSISETYGSTTASTLSAKINQLLGV